MAGVLRSKRGITEDNYELIILLLDKDIGAQLYYVEIQMFLTLLLSRQLIEMMRRKNF